MKASISMTIRIKDEYYVTLIVFDSLIISSDL